MHDVTIDGVIYRPAKHDSGIGIAITTTLERKEAYVSCITNMLKHRPPFAKLVVVVDGKDIQSSREILETLLPDPDDHIHFIGGDKKAGIPAAKNACLELLKDCEHKFLFDDDAWPVCNGWERPYINSGAHHLSYQFADLSGDKKLGDMRQVYGDGEIVGFTGQRGVMLYYTGTAIDKVGGFDPAYGLGMYEHVDLAMRIYAANMTVTPFGDVVNSANLFYSLDEHQQVVRTIADAVRQELNARNAKIFNGRVADFRKFGQYPVGYIDYTGSVYKSAQKIKRLYLTTIITGANDPQRQGINFDASGVTAWYESIIKNDPDADIIILTDNCRWVTDSRMEDICHLMPLPMRSDCSVYFQRWAMVNAYIKRHGCLYSEVFITDGTDVTLLNPPALEPSDSHTLFTGNEHSTLASPWMVKNHTAPDTSEMITKSARTQLYNAGIVGGRTEIVSAFVSRICNIMHYRIHESLFSNKPQPEVFDMGVFNLAARDMFRQGIDISTGPHVNTVFKSYGMGNESAWFQHK